MILVLPALFLHRVFNFAQTRCGNGHILDELRSEVRPEASPDVVLDPRHWRKRVKISADGSVRLWPLSRPVSFAEAMFPGPTAISQSDRTGAHPGSRSGQAFSGCSRLNRGRWRAHHSIILLFSSIFVEFRLIPMRTWSRTLNPRQFP
jgi:hypothetical protein